MAPMKPATSAVIRRPRMRSPRNSTAPSVAKRGAVKLIAETLAKGVMPSAMKNISMPAT